MHKFISCLFFLTIINSSNSMELDERGSKRLTPYVFNIAYAVAQQKKQMEERIAQADAQAAATLQAHQKAAEPNYQFCILF